MSKITLSLKKYKKSSIDLVEKTFDSELRGEWTGNWEVTELYTATYLAKKYSDILHILPFINFQILYDLELQKTVLVLGDRNTLKLNFLGKDNFEPYLKKYRATDKRFTFYPISTAELNAKGDGLDYHAVSALYDKKTNKIEIFDSIGSDFTLYKETFKELFISIYGVEVKIVYIVDRCVAFGKLEAAECEPWDYKYNSEGFCSIWVIWFLELRLANPGFSKEKLVQKALKRLKNSNKVCEFIRGYAQFVDNIFSKYSLDRTVSNLIIRPKNSKKNPEFTKKDYPYLYIILATIFGSVIAAGIIQKNKKLNF